MLPGLKYMRRQLVSQHQGCTSPGVETLQVQPAVGATPPPYGQRHGRRNSHGADLWFCSDGESVNRSGMRKTGSSAASKQSRFCSPCGAASQATTTSIAFRPAARGASCIQHIKIPSIGTQALSLWCIETVICLLADPSLCAPVAMLAVPRMRWASLLVTAHASGEPAPNNKPSVPPTGARCCDSLYLSVITCGTFSRLDGLA